MSKDQVNGRGYDRNLRARTISVPQAGREYFGIGHSASYKAAASGQIPTIRVGRLLRVPVQAMEKMLDIAPTARPDAA
jgi:hypothetical protein